MPDMGLRIGQWATGNVGRAALRGAIGHPHLDPVAVLVSSPSKDGVDAGELAGMGTTTGVRATTDRQALLDAEPDVVCYAAMADDRLGEAVEDLCWLLREGVDVVSACPVFLQFPHGVADELGEQVHRAALEGGASLFVNGIDPGFANDTLPLVLSGICERIDTLRCTEILDYASYRQPKVMREIMGFGQPVDEVPLLLQPGVLTLAWGSVLHQLAAGLGVQLERIIEHHERVAAPHDVATATGTIVQGTAAGLRFELTGLVSGEPRLALEHVTRTHPDLAPHWPQPAGQGCERVEITGSPDCTLDLQLRGADDDPNDAGLTVTAMRLLNAAPHVTAAKPGLLTALDLPLVTGHGLMRG